MLSRVATRFEAAGKVIDPLASGVRLAYGVAVFAREIGLSPLVAVYARGGSITALSVRISMNSFFVGDRYGSRLSASIRKHLTMVVG